MFILFFSSFTKRADYICLSLASTLSGLLQALTEHCLSSALSQLQSVRTMAITNCLYLLKYTQEPPHGKVCSFVSCSALY